MYWVFGGVPPAFCSLTFSILYLYFHVPGENQLLHGLFGPSSEDARGKVILMTLIDAVIDAFGSDLVCIGLHCTLILVHF